MYLVRGLFEGLYRSVGEPDSILRMENRFRSGGKIESENIYLYLYPNLWVQVNQNDEVIKPAVSFKIWSIFISPSPPSISSNQRYDKIASIRISIVASVKGTFALYMMLSESFTVILLSLISLHMHFKKCDFFAYFIYIVFERVSRTL